MEVSYFCPRCGAKYSSKEYLEDKFCRKWATYLQKSQRPRRRKYWLFQANPRKYRIFDWWEENPTEESITWSIRQHQNEIRKGDRGVIWLSGDRSGIYALVEVATNPKKN